MKTILFLDEVHENLQIGLESLGWKCIDATQLDFLKIAKFLPDAHGIVIRSRYKMDECFLQHATKLEFIARSGAGMENIDIDYCKKKNIQLFNAPEGNRQAVAEHAVGMLLSLFNKLNSADKEVSGGQWDREGNRGVELSERTIGLIGFGNNGAATGNVLKGFGCKILAYDKYKSGFGGDGIEEVDLEDIFNRADVVSFHVPQTDETVYFLDEDFIAKMKNDFYLINLSRGKVVSSEALMNGLKSGKILGAGLDVLEYEKSSFEHFFTANETLPEPFQYFIDSQNVILSPHVGGWTQESYRKLSDVLLFKILEANK